MELPEIRNKLVEYHKQINEIHKQQGLLMLEIKPLLENEPDKKKRKKIIEFLFKDKVHELFEYYLINIYVS